jgi:type IV fimbrial biogenesis protein FimT
MKMKSAQASQSRGFTLIELLITIAVLTILIVLATPSFFDAIDRRRVVDATEAIGKQVQQARMTAIETSRPITMVFDTGDPWCFGLTDAAGCDCSIGSSNTCTIPFGLITQTVDGITSLGLDPTTAREEVVGRGGNAGQFPGVDLVDAPATLRFEPRRGVRVGGAPVEEILVTSARGTQARVMINIIGRVSTCSDDIAGMKPCP